MCAAKDLTAAQQKAIVRGRDQGRTHEQLAGQFGVSRSCITRFLKRWKVQGCRVVKRTHGSKPVTNQLVDRNILRVSRSNPRLTAPQILAAVSPPGAPVASLTTIRRRLQAAGLHGRRPVKKPMISKKNRTLRLVWAREHKDWTAADWSRVLWSDESKFMLFGSDGINWIRRPEGSRYDPKYQLPTIKHGGGSVMVWSCFSAKGVGPLHRVVGILDRFGYEDILETKMRPFALQSIGPNFLFQQDNDPKHTSKHIQVIYSGRKWFMSDLRDGSIDVVWR